MDASNHIPAKVKDLFLFTKNLLSQHLNKEIIAPPSNFYAPADGETWTNPDRAKVYKITEQAVRCGYRLGGQKIEINKLDQETMLNGAKFYENIEELPPLETPFNTTFHLVEDDTFNVLLKLKKEGKNPVGINMAHSVVRGGGVIRGAAAQEESLYRRSDYHKADELISIKKAKLHEGVLYTPSITVFREDEDHGFAFMEKPETVNIVAVAAFDFREHSLDRKALRLPASGPLDENKLRRNVNYVNGTKNRIRNMLRIMAHKEHKDIVLGALGCGAFLNPPKLIADLYAEVFNEPEFKGRFNSVHFAIILKNLVKDRPNLEAFADFCIKMQG